MRADHEGRAQGQEASPFSNTRNNPAPKQCCLASSADQSSRYWGRWAGRPSALTVRPMQGQLSLMLSRASEPDDFDALLAAKRRENLVRARAEVHAKGDEKLLAW